MPRGLLCALALALVFVASPAQAVLITVNFSVTAAFSSITGSGSFTFDDSIIPSGGGTLGNLLGTVDLSSDSNGSFTSSSNGITQSWGSGNSGVNYLVFDSSGTLTEWQIGGDPSGIGGLTSLVDDFRIQSLSISESAFFEFGAAAGDGGSSGGLANNIVVWSATSSPGSAPEPGSWVLLGFGLAGIVAARRRGTRELV